MPNGNESRMHMVEYEGELINITQLAYRVGMQPATIYGRIVVRKMSVEDAINTPVRKMTHKVKRKLAIWDQA